MKNLSAPATALAVLVAATLADAAVPNIGARRELFVDDHLIETLKNCELRLHRPIPREAAIVHDAPWEGNLSCYHTVFKDGDLYRMYYRGTQLDFARGVRKMHEDVTCYAESDDGIHWRKPELKLFEFKGSKKNNIILDGYPAHNFAPFIDTNPDCPPEQKYKALGGNQGLHVRHAGEKDSGIYAYSSADGIHWKKLQEKQLWTKNQGNFDSQNIAFWDPVREEYRAYFRITRRVGGKRVRDIKTAVSKDFVEWSEAEWCVYPGAPVEQLYTNQTIPYFRAPHIFVAFPNRYVDQGGGYSVWRDVHNHWPIIEERKQRFEASRQARRYATAVTDGVFMSSRDGRTFQRWREAFLRPRPGSWAYTDSMFAWQLVETKSDLEGAPPEISMYALENAWTGQSTTLRRYTLRLDGFVSVRAGAEEGEMATRPFVFGGKALEINYATSAAGSVRVEIQDEAGRPVPGFTFADCPPIVGDRVDRLVSWNGGADLSGLAGKTIRLRFLLADADLYAMRFVPEIPRAAFTPTGPTASLAAGRMANAAIQAIAARRNPPQSIGELTKELEGALATAVRQSGFSRPEYMKGVRHTLKGVLSHGIAVPRLKTAPNVDGGFGKAEWSQAAAVNIGAPIGETENGKQAAPEQTTKVYLGYDDDCLYLCFVCQEEDVAKLIAECTERDGSVWRDDSVEWILQRPATAAWHHFIANSLGAVYDSKAIPHDVGRAQPDIEWNVRLRVATAAGAPKAGGTPEAENKWYVEAAVPWSDLAEKPAKGTLLRANFCRDNIRNPGAQWYKDRESWSWAPAPHGFNNPGCLGLLLLD